MEEIALWHKAHNESGEEKTHEFISNNKKAFHMDAYRPLRWPPLDVSTGVYLLGGVYVWGWPSGGVPFECVPSKGCTFQRMYLLRGYLAGLYLPGEYTLWSFTFGRGDVPSGGVSSRDVYSGGVMGVYLACYMPWYTLTQKEHPLEVTLTWYTPSTPPGIPTSIRDLGPSIPIFHIFQSSTFQPLTVLINNHYRCSVENGH